MGAQDDEIVGPSGGGRAALFAAAADLQRFCGAHRWKTAIIGGLAVQRWGEPRQTRDVDVALAKVGDVSSDAIAPSDTVARFASSDTKQAQLRERLDATLMRFLLAAVSPSLVAPTRKVAQVEGRLYQRTMAGPDED